MAEKRCEFSYFIGSKRLSQSRKSYRTELLFKAVKYRKISLIKTLLKLGVRINALKEQSIKNCFHSFLMVNAINGNKEITRMLIRAGCQLNTITLGGCTALHLAVEFHNLGIAAELIQSGANVNLKTDRGGTALHVAIVGSTNIDRHLKETEMNMNRYAFHPLKALKDAREFQGSIVKARISGIVQTLFTRGQDRRVCLYLVKMLLNAGANVNLKDNYGCTPIHYAACTGSPELVKILIAAGADVDIQNNVGATALHIAVLFCDELTVNLLLSCGANVAVKTLKGGNTALHWAVKLNNGFNCHTDIVRNLMDFGSNVNERNAIDEPVIAMASGYVNRSLVLEHVAEMEARTCETLFDELSLKEINSWANMRNEYEKLMIQLTSMKKDKIGSTLIDYFFVLTESLEVLSLLASNEQFVNEFDASDYRTAYPGFASRLREKITAAKRSEKGVKWPCVVDISCNI